MRNVGHAAKTLVSRTNSTGEIGNLNPRRYPCGKDVRKSHTKSRGYVENINKCHYLSQASSMLFRQTLGAA